MTHVRQSIDKKEYAGDVINLFVHTVQVFKMGYMMIVMTPAGRKEKL